MIEEHRDAVERRLADLGIEATVESAGAEGEIAVVRLSDSERMVSLLTDRREAVVNNCRKAGFRYVTLELY